MTRLEEALFDAAADVRRAVERVDVPPVDEVVGARRPTAPLVVLAAAAILGIVGLLVALPRLGDSVDGPVVATRPETVDDRRPTTPDETDDLPLPTADPAGEPTPQVTPPASTPAPDAGGEVPVLPPASVDGTLANPLVGRLTNAGSGEFLTISPEVPAWNADESRLLVYRTGAADPGHVVVDTATGEVIAEVDLRPPDIEQLYWHPADPNRLLAFEGNELWAFDVDSNERTELASFDECANLDAGFPSPPARTGEMVAICPALAGPELLVYDLDAATTFTSPIAAAVTSVHVAPEGDLFVLAFDDGTIETLRSDLQPLQRIDIGSDNFTLMSTEAGALIAAVQYSGDFIGSVVTYTPDGEGEVLIGPEGGHEYPPPGTALDGDGFRIAFATRGPAAELFAGRIVFVDLRIGGYFAGAVEHGSTGAHGYWSEVFVSVSPSGRYVAYATDSGTDRVDVHIAEFPQ